MNGCTIVTIPSFDLTTQRENANSMPFLREKVFSHGPLQAPVSVSMRSIMVDKNSRCSFQDSIFTSALNDPSAQKNQTISAVQITEENFTNPQLLGNAIGAYLMSASDLHANSFPLYARNLAPKPPPGSDEPWTTLAVPAGFVSVEVVGGADVRESNVRAPVSLATDLLAIDCEMVETTFGKELARVAVLGGDQTLKLDLLVKPEGRVVDCLTRWSGITEAMISTDPAVERDATWPPLVSLHEAQQALLAVMSPTTVLIGHSLENDLSALRLVHTRVLDTSILYPHPMPHCRQSLAYLAKTFLRTDLACLRSDQGGHDPAVDAKIALQLALLKLRNGPDFGAKLSASARMVLGKLPFVALLDESLKAKNNSLIGEAHPSAALPAAESTPNTEVDAAAAAAVKAKMDLEDLVCDSGVSTPETAAESPVDQQLTGGGDATATATASEPAGKSVLALFDSLLPRRSGALFHRNFDAVDLRNSFAGASALEDSASTAAAVSDDGEDDSESGEGAAKRMKTTVHATEVLADAPRVVLDDIPAAVEGGRAEKGGEEGNKNLSEDYIRRMDEEVVDRYTRSHDPEAGANYLPSKTVRVVMLRELQRLRCLALNMQRLTDFDLAAQKATEQRKAVAYSVAAKRAEERASTGEACSVVPPALCSALLPKLDSAKVKEAMARLDASVRKMVESAPAGHVFLFLSGSGDVARYVALCSAKRMFQEAQLKAKQELEELMSQDDDSDEEDDEDESDDDEGEGGEKPENQGGDVVVDPVPPDASAAAASDAVVAAAEAAAKDVLVDADAPAASSSDTKTESVSAEDDEDEGVDEDELDMLRVEVEALQWTNAMDRELEIARLASQDAWGFSICAQAKTQ